MTLEKTTRYPWTLLRLADPSKTMIDKYLYGGECYVLHHNGECAGVVVLTFHAGSAEINNMAVAEHLHGHGLGRRLIEGAAQICKSRQTPVLTVGTSAGNVPFYQHCGFQVYGTKKNFFADHYDTPIIENGVQIQDMILLQKECA